MIFILFSVSLAHADSYVIGEGDRLQISVWGIKEYNVSVMVRRDGMISVPGVGDILAIGKKPEDLRMELTERLKELIKNPIVTVMVTDVNDTKVSIFGNGTRPGVFDIKRKTTLLQILCTLTLSKSADLDSAYLLRKNVKIKEGFYNLFINGDVSEDITIEANDVLFIPAYSNSHIYIMGGVGSQKAIEFRAGISVLDVIFESGGFTKFANLNDVTIIRREKGKQISIPVKIEKLVDNADLNQNIKLKPGDYVIVRESIL